MTRGKSSHRRPHAVRREAEERLKEKDWERKAQDLTKDDILGLNHELEVHRIELELQNEELRNALAELADSRDRYLELYDFAPVGLFTLDEQDIITEVNLAGAGLLQYERRGLVGKLFRSFIAPASRVAYDDCLAKAKGRSVKQSCEIKVLDRHGKASIVIIEVVPIDDKRKGRLLRLAILDITGRRQVEEMRIAMEAAQRANRLKNEFLANMSHEIRTPLNGIIGLNQLALMGTKDPKAREYLQKAREPALWLLTMLGDVLDLAKIEAGKEELKPEAFDLRGEVSAVLGSSGVEAANKGLELRSTVDEQVPHTLYGDRGKFRQVLSNLVSNAVKYTQHGSVSVSVDLAGPLREAHPVMLRCIVADTGIGIEPGMLEHIFESFTRIETSSMVKTTSGMGLGLAISKRLVEMMGGEISVRSSAGNGSTFTFTLPLMPAHQARARESTRDAAGPQRPLHILLAEDNAINQLVTSEHLTLRGHSVEIAANGREALDKLSRGSFDLVLMDVRMPELSGEEATRAIRGGEVLGVDPHVPIVALTAYALAGDRERFLAAGMDDYLSKPVDPRELDRVLARVPHGNRNA